MTARTTGVILSAMILACTAGCAGRYVGPGSGTREERQQKREQQHAASTEVVDPRVTSPQEQAQIDNSGIPAAK